ncbi:MAG: hypothetical protein ACTSUE_11235 [Promethearchaeota archaeon]
MLVELSVTITTSTAGITGNSAGYGSLGFGDRASYVNVRVVIDELGVQAPRAAEF